MLFLIKPNTPSEYQKVITRMSPRPGHIQTHMRHTSFILFLLFTAHVSGTTEAEGVASGVPSPNSGTSGTSRKRLNNSPLEGKNKKTCTSSTQLITITVGLLGGDEFVVFVESNATIQDLKKEIGSCRGIPPERMHLFTPVKPLLRNSESIDVLGPEPTVTVLVIVLAESLEEKFETLLSAVYTNDETGLKTLDWDAFTHKYDESEIAQYARLIPQLVDVECLKFFSYSTSKSPLPDLLGLVNLVELYCYCNKLTEMPDLSALVELTTLDCRSNQLTKLPDMSALVNLTTLDCRFNQLTRLPDLSGLVLLKHFDCTDNQLTELPPLSALANLIALHCCNNHLTTMPDLSGLTNLKSLRCSQNQLTAMPDLSALVNLYELVICFNFFTQLPIGLSALKSLVTLVCDEEHCSDNQLSALVSLKYLRHSL